jgi:pentatricopeptide repeat protein
MSENKKAKLDISTHIYLQRDYVNIFDSHFSAASFEEAHQMLDQMEKLLTLEYERVESKNNG